MPTFRPHEHPGVHSTRLAEWALRVARKLDVPEKCLYRVEVAALLRDVGKIGVPDAILKKSAPLTAEERTIINRHPEYSGRSCAYSLGLKKPVCSPCITTKVSTEVVIRRA